MRGLRLWQMLFAIKRELGIFSGDKSNINYIFIKYQDYSAKGNMFWTAATVHNSVQDYRTYAPTEGIGLPPQGLKIFISKGSYIGNGGATPMFAKRLDAQSPLHFGQSYFDIDPNRVNGIFLVIKKRLDMIIGYRYETNGIRDVTELLSDRIKETTYHELTHSAHYAALGTVWYGAFVNAEVTEIEQTYLFDKGYVPYGRGTDGNSPQIALGEGWAYHMGHYLANKTYGTNSSEQDEFGQGNYTNGNPVGTLSSHLNLLEDFSPYRTGDPFHWIPQGLFYDLMDARNEQKATGGPVDDNVSGYYTNHWFFNAFSSSVTTLGSYKSNLLQQNNNNQSTQISSLFAQYGY